MRQIARWRRLKQFRMRADVPGQGYQQQGDDGAADHQFEGGGPAVAVDEAAEPPPVMIVEA